MCRCIAKIGKREGAATPRPAGEGAPLGAQPAGVRPPPRTMEGPRRGGRRRRRKRREVSAAAAVAAVPQPPAPWGSAPGQGARGVAGAAPGPGITRGEGGGTQSAAGGGSWGARGEHWGARRFISNVISALTYSMCL